MPKMTYCWRTTSPQFLGEAVSELDQVLLSALRQITVGDGPRFGDFQLQLSSLPVSFGGLGIQLPSDVAKFAFVASAVSSVSLQNRILGIPGEDLPADMRARLQEYSQSLSLNDDARVQLTNSSLSPQSNLQLSMAREFYKVKRVTLMQHPYIQRAPENVRKQFHVVLESAVQPIASAWLFAIPNAGMFQRMNALEFQAAMALRLLMPLFSCEKECVAQSCSRPMDIYGYHALACHGRLMINRHNLLRDALYDLSSMARFHPVKDADVHCLGTRNNGTSATFRPADLLIAGDDFHQDCVDVTVISPITRNMPAHGSVTAAVEEAEKKKYDKHQEACEVASYGFKAFAASVFGVLAERSKHLLNRICKALIRNASLSEYLAKAVTQRRVSFAIQLGVARQVVARREVLEET
jgi:hypothetical protein